MSSVCPKCGKYNSDSATNCMHCGSAMNAPYSGGVYNGGNYGGAGNQPYISPRLASFANKALTFGIIGICVPFFIFSCLALGNSNSFYAHSNGLGSGKAKAGKILGIVGLVYSVLTIVYIIFYAIILQKYASAMRYYY